MSLEGYNSHDSFIDLHSAVTAAWDIYTNIFDAHFIHNSQKLYSQVHRKKGTDLLQVVNFIDLSTSCNKLVTYIKVLQVCK